MSVIFLKVITRFEPTFSHKFIHNYQEIQQQNRDWKKHERTVHAKLMSANKRVCILTKAESIRSCWQFRWSLSIKECNYTCTEETCTIHGRGIIKFYVFTVKNIQRRIFNVNVKRGRGNYLHSSRIMTFASRKLKK